MNLDQIICIIAVIFHLEKLHQCFYLWEQNMSELLIDFLLIILGLSRASFRHVVHSLRLVEESLVLSLNEFATLEKQFSRIK